MAMARASLGRELIAGSLVVFCCSVRCAAGVFAQDSASSFDTRGQATVNGKTIPYLVRHLPVNAFPELPAAIQERLTRRGCLIPQTYEAHQPENVVHASLERRGSSDWAVLCSAHGEVSLLVFLGSGEVEAAVLATVPETSRLQMHSMSDAMGFNWAIDSATPEQIHEAQLDMHHPPPRMDHDGLADSAVDGKTVYRFLKNGAWTVVDTRD
jgi:hypothetical protein